MNAFKACMLEDTMADSILMKESAYNVVSQDKDTIRSILEIENQGIIDEMNARREMYIHILENVGKEEVLTEAVSMKVVAAVIAACIAVVGAIIAMIMGKGSGGGGGGGGGGSSKPAPTSPTPSPRPTTPRPSTPTPSPSNTNTSNKPKAIAGEKRLDDKFTDDTYVNKNFDYRTWSIDRSFDMYNPYITNWFRYGGPTERLLGKEQNIGDYLRIFKAIARHTTCEVTKYQLPNEEIITGSIESVSDIYNSVESLIELCKRILQEIRNGTTGDEIKERILDDNTVEKFKSKCEAINDNISQLKVSSDDMEEYHKTVNADDYLSDKPEFINKMNPTSESIKKDTKYVFVNPKQFQPSDKLKNLHQKLFDLQLVVNKFPGDSEGETINAIGNTIAELAKEIRGSCVKAVSAIKKSITTYYAQAKKNAGMSDVVVDAVIDLSNYRNEYNSNAISNTNARLDGYINDIMYDEGIRNLQQIRDKEESKDQQQESAFYESASIREYTYHTETDLETTLMMESAYQEVDDTIMRYNIRYNEYLMRAVNEEAMIFISEETDWEKYKRLCTLNEALGYKIKRIFYNTIAKLKEIFAKFLEKLRGNFGFTKNYLDKYKDIILKKPFNNTEYSTQDLLKGINRIEVTEVPMLDLAALDTKLDSQEVFFRDVAFKKANSPDKEDTDASNNFQDQAGFWKSYFCMTNHDRKYTGPEFQKDCLKTVYEFLYDIRKTEQVIKKSIKTIDDTASKILKQAGIDANKPNETEQTASTESAPVWSNLYQKYFVYENGVLTEVKVNSPANDQGGQQQQQNTTFSQKVGTVEKAKEGKEPDNVGTAKNSNRGIIDTRLNNYVVVCSTMLKAKMSACEFIRSEGMGIIRTHVKSYIGNDQAAQQQGNNQGGNNAPAQGEKPKNDVGAEQRGTMTRY